jgi:hypothetical protein
VSKAIWWAIVIFGIGVFAFIVYNATQKSRPEREQPSPPPAVAPPAPTSSAEPEIRFPVRQEPQEKPLPALGESDAAVKEALGGLWSDKTLEEFFQLKDFIRRVVATIDNLPRSKLAFRLMPVKPAPGKFLTAGENESLAVSPQNAARYALMIKLAEAVDTKKLVALYVRFYPLFQQAYQDLGYPKGYFNDRLVEVIDHLLAAPEARAPVRLVRPKVFYQFADPELEARSAGQKILIRIGNENAARIKAKLREIRGELTRQHPEE